jgi:hypothetical protein
LANTVIDLHKTLRKPTEEVRPMTNTSRGRASGASAYHAWNGYCDLIRVRDNITKSAAIDAAHRTETGRSLFELAKLGGGGDWPTASAHSGAEQRSLDDGGEAERLYTKYLARVQQLCDGGMKPSAAHDRARSELDGEQFAKVKSIKAGSLLSPFEQQPRSVGPHSASPYAAAPYKRPSGIVSAENVTHRYK